MGLRKIILLSFLGLFLLTSNSHAGWQNPVEIIRGAWGNGPSQFFFGAGDTVDTFPRDIGIDSQGRLFINDESNLRIQIFANDGSLAGIIGAPQGVNTALGWPYNIYVHPSGTFVASYEGPHKFFYDSSGNLVNKSNIYGAAVPTTEGYFFEVTKTQYALYSPTGQLIKTSSERPLELGKVSEKILGVKKTKITVTYPDKIYSLIGLYEKYVRDTKGYLNAVSGKFVRKFNQCGTSVGSLAMPDDQSNVVRPGGNGQDEVRSLIAEYGQPVIAPNGDVYTWKRTPDTYSILKWTWQDDSNAPVSAPDAPTGLRVTASTTGILLNWTSPVQDPGCVTGYEIARSTISGGPYTTVATVNAGTATYSDTSASTGTTYYYVARALSGSNYSTYSSEIQGKR
jgi:hypothetical protein